MQHGGPEERMEVSHVFADEMYLFGFRVGKEFIEIKTFLFAVGFQSGEISHRRIKPDVEVLARRIRNSNAKVRRITRDVPVSKMSVGTQPFAVFGENFFLYAGETILAVPGCPFTQKFHTLWVREFEEVVRRRTQFRTRTRKC